MFAATALGIFDGRRPVEYKELPRLLDACVALGLLVRRSDGEYVNTAESERFLRSDSPETLSGYVLYSNAALYPMWANLEEALKEGTPRWKQTFGLEGPIFSAFFRTDDAMREFLKGMHGFGQLSSPAVAETFDLSRFHRMVDLGGASGHLAKAIRERYPAMATTVFDLPVVKKAYPEVVAGDFFTDPLPEADLYVLSRILHDWSEPKIRLLLRKIHDALPRGGGLLIAETLLDERAVPAHMQSLNMLICTEGRERTLNEYSALLKEAGFGSVEGRRTGALLDAILAVR